jgi:hypothetical protein
MATKNVQQPADGTRAAKDIVVLTQQVDASGAVVGGAGTSAGNVGLTPRTSGGLSIYRNIDLDETGVSIKASAGQLYGWYIYNAAATVRYVKFYNKATAATVGTDTPVLTLPLPATSGANVEFSQGIAFATGIAAGATTGVADNSTGAPAANDVQINVFYA